MHPTEKRKNAARASKYSQFRNQLLEVKPFMSLNDINVFEESNRISVSVYSLEQEIIVPLRISKQQNYITLVNLLYLEADSGQSHYVLIRDLGKLLHHCSFSESSYVRLPKEIRDKKACINFQCKDQKSFKWAILAHKYHEEVKDNPNRVSNLYKYDKEFSNYKYPLKLSDTPAFERKENISINVYRLNSNNNVEPCYMSSLKQSNPYFHVDLLLEKDHYNLIKDLSRLVRSQVSKSKNAHYPCKRCLTLCTSPEILQRHEERCNQHRAQRIEMVKEKDSTLRFTSIEKMLKLPFWFVADFEAIIEKLPTERTENEEEEFIQTGNRDDVSKTHNGPSTNKITKHRACGVAYQLLSVDPRFNEDPVVIRGENCAEEFLDRIIEKGKQVREWLNHPEPQPILTEEEEFQQKFTENCHICEKSMYLFPEEIGHPEKQENTIVADHCHITGKYR